MLNTEHREKNHMDKMSGKGEEENIIVIVEASLTVRKEKDITKISQCGCDKSLFRTHIEKQHKPQASSHCLSFIMLLVHTVRAGIP